MKLINLFNNHIFIFTILSILFAILPVKSNFTYVETSENPNSPRVYNIESYEDNTIVVHLVRRNSSDPNNSDERVCVDRVLSFRTIYPNGTVKPIDIPLDILKIQEFNFCILSIDEHIYNPINIYPVKSNFLLVTYGVATDENDFDTYEEWAMIIDLNGNILRLGKKN